MSATSDIEKGTGAVVLETSAVAGGQAYYAQGSLRKIGSSAPLGFLSFASTTFILSLFNLHTRHIAAPNLIVGMAVGCGGLGQLLAGMWEFACGNTFSGTVNSSYGGFWISFAVIYWPGSGVMAAYQNTPDQLNSAMGIYLATWFIVTFIFFLTSLRTNLSSNLIYALLSITFILLSAGSFTGQIMLTKAGGGSGAVTAMIAYYTAVSELINTKDSFIDLPLGAHRRLD